MGMTPPPPPGCLLNYSFCWCLSPNLWESGKQFLEATRQFAEIMRYFAKIWHRSPWLAHILHIIILRKGNKGIENYGPTGPTPRFIIPRRCLQCTLLMTSLVSSYINCFLGSERNLYS